jgi:hypothetical protein
MARPDRPVRLEVVLKRYSPECVEKLSDNSQPRANRLSIRRLIAA